MQPDLSIVIPTCDRGRLLAACLRRVRDTVALRYEVIVVDGASTDDTPAVLAASGLGGRLTVIRESARAGFTQAANRGFAAARGTFVTWLNDDARPLPGCYDRAVDQLAESPADVGLLALYHRWPSPRNVAHDTTIGGRSYQVCHVRGTVYANFGLARRSTFDRLGHFDERFYFYGADPDFSLKVWHAGLRVVPADAGLCGIDHDETPDGRRAADQPRGRADNAALFAKWDLPPADPARNDFDPARPCTLRGLQSRAAA